MKYRHGGRRPHVVVIGNEKGGSGKSTTAMHLTVSLLKRDFRVGTIDLDARQGSFSRYIENRLSYIEATGLELPCPEHRRIYSSTRDIQEVAEQEEKQSLQTAWAALDNNDFIVIDTPGSDSSLSRLGHIMADTLVTPLNDSFLDMDMLGRVELDGEDYYLSPSVYSQMVWEQRQQRAMDRLPPMDWIIMRNRLSHINARNKKDIGQLLEQLSKRLRFRIAPGFGERVVFRELFPKGLTLLDLGDSKGDVAMSLSLSHVAARQELRQLLEVLNLPGHVDEQAGDAAAAEGAAAQLDQTAVSAADGMRAAAGAQLREEVEAASEA
ncbi:division plane positioning ATPase MipZ [Denitrobaculum tricleocarpae]|uniref:AAA family ATPase n=1 Tax=Denitrobaculum tricleocarpae TaxID=2591009 RepID=A0A545TXX0_9PROT|nr:division plane positioning ATPase MipZ [Denitrobaculum tricleocarpae]TQV82065.1 AAA family ATPase [Denitrobaculum tricleocarpae]